MIVGLYINYTTKLTVTYNFIQSCGPCITTSLFYAEMTIYFIYNRQYVLYESKLPLGPILKTIPLRRPARSNALDTIQYFFQI